MKKLCSICSAPADVRSAVNQALADGEPLRQIAARSAFSRASLSRHSRKCLPAQTIREHRNSMANAGHARHIIEWPPENGIPARLVIYDTETPGHEQTIDENEILETDVILAVSFETFKPRNPKS